MNFRKLKQEQARRANCHYSYGIPLRHYREPWDLLFHLKSKLRHYMERKVKAAVRFDCAS